MNNGFVPLWILVLALLVLLFTPIPFRYETVICAEPLVYPSKYAPCPKQLTIGWSPSIFQSLYKIINARNIKPPQTDDITGKPCGGIAGETGELACPAGYRCQYSEPPRPDEQGKCVKMGILEELRWNNP